MVHELDLGQPLSVGEAWGEVSVEQEGAASETERDSGNYPVRGVVDEVGGLRWGAQGPEPRCAEARAPAGCGAVVGLVPQREGGASCGRVPKLLLGNNVRGQGLEPGAGEGDLAGDAPPVVGKEGE